MENEDWGLQVGNLSLQESFEDSLGAESKTVDESSNVVLGSTISFPLEVIYQVAFVGGKRGSGKSYTSGVMMEEFNRLGLQFVCIDPLDAHGHLSSLDGIESISPSKQETINMGKLISKLKRNNNSLVINMAGLPLEMQQKLIAEYCEALLQADLGNKGLMTFFEECQDFIPQMGRPTSFAPIVRLCKLGRAKGYGAMLISQRPAAVSKEALSQASIYMVHNVINTKDLEALKDQLSFGTDKTTIKKILDGITYADAGEMVCYAPEFFKDKGYVVVGQVDRTRKTEHKGKNIDVRASLSPPTQFQSFNSAGGDLEGEGVFDIEDLPEFTNHSQDNMTSKESENTDTYEWAPQNFEEKISKDAEGEKKNTKTVQAVGAIGLIGVGVYLVTRGLSKQTE